MSYPIKRFVYEVEPMGKVRQSQSDKWKIGDKARPRVKRYRAYHDRLRELGATLEPGDEIHFKLACPKSWSKSEKNKHDGMPHMQKPDLTNLIGGYEDGVLEEDKGMWIIGETSKRWTTGSSSITIIRKERQ